MQVTAKNLAHTLRAEQQAMYTLAEKLHQRADSMQGLQHWAQSLQTTLHQDFATVRAQLPALRNQLEQVILDNAHAGDTTLTDMESLQHCPEALPGRGIDLRSIEWKLGP